MHNFVKTFRESRLFNLENSINKYAIKKSAKIVSVSITKEPRGYIALVAFEKR